MYKRKKSQEEYFIEVENKMEKEEEESTAYSYAIEDKPAELAFLQRVVASCQKGATRHGVVLDIGCGAHLQAARYFANAAVGTGTGTLFSSIVATDIDGAACAAAANVAVGDAAIQVVQHDARTGIAQLPLTAAPVQLISLFYILQHLEKEAEVQLLFQQCSALLAPGGTMAISAFLDQVTVTQSTAAEDDQVGADGSAMAARTGVVTAPESDAALGTMTTAAVAAAATGKTVVLPLDPFLKPLYKSFTTVDLLTNQLAVAGFGVPFAHVSTRPSSYPNEFPCDRCYVVATKAMK